MSYNYCTLDLSLAQPNGCEPLFPFPLFNSTTPYGKPQPFQPICLLRVYLLS
jgi:hypothetical protein